MRTLLPRLLSTASVATLATFALLTGCAGEAEEATQSAAGAVGAFPEQCPQFAGRHVAKGAWGGDHRECVIERCAPGWANAEADDGSGNPRMKGRYESGILGMIDHQRDGCETRLAPLIAARSAPGVENLGELAGDATDARALEVDAVGNHVYRVRIKETHAGLPKPQRIIVTLTHYESMPYRMELSAARDGGAQEACSGDVRTLVLSDPENDASYKSSEANKMVDFTAAKVLMQLAGVEAGDAPGRDDSFDVFIKVSLPDPSRASAVGNPGFSLEVEQDKYGGGPLPIRCAERP